MRIDSLLALKAVSKLSVSKTSSGLRSCVEIENCDNCFGVWHRAGWRTRRTASTQNKILRTPWRRHVNHTHNLFVRSANDSLSLQLLVLSLSFKRFILTSFSHVGGSDSIGAYHNQDPGSGGFHEC
jgi:Zn-finger nucleic acid-binding protein